MERLGIKPNMEKQKEMGSDIKTKTEETTTEVVNINSFAVKEVRDISEKTTINIEKLKEIEKQLQHGEVIKITDIKAFSTAINGGTTAPISLKNKLYRLYINNSIDLKPIMRDRVLYLKRK